MNVIVLECVCGNAVDYPGHPDVVEAVQCVTCGRTYAIAEPAAIPVSRT